MWITIAVLSALNLAPGDAGNLKLARIRSTCGIQGPARASEKYVPGDSLTLNFDIEGNTVDEKGKVLYSIETEVTNVGDKSVVFRQPAQKLEMVTVFGGNRIPGFAHLDVGVEQPPGDYAMKVTVTDRASNTTQELTHKFTVLKPDFAVCRLRTSSDKDGTVPVPALGEGQTIWINFGIVGFGRDAGTKQPNVQFDFNVLDDSGKATMAKPYGTTINKDVPEKNVAIPMQFPLSLTRPGKFTFEITATDQVTKKSAKLSVPITVLAVK